MTDDQYVRGKVTLRNGLRRAPFGSKTGWNRSMLLHTSSKLASEISIKHREGGEVFKKTLRRLTDEFSKKQGESLKGTTLSIVK